jgi:hypothetical protein
MYLFLCVMTYRSSFVRICITIPSDLRNSRGCIQRETWVMGPCAGADYNLTLSHIDDSGVQLSIPVTNAYEWFLNYSKMEQPLGKGKIRGRGGFNSRKWTKNLGSDLSLKSQPVTDSGSEVHSGGCWTSTTRSRSLNFGQIRINLYV